MKKEIIICDACGKTGASSLIVAVDRKLDAAGSPETWHETIDLCHECTRKELLRLASEWSYAHAREWVANIRALKVAP